MNKIKLAGMVASEPQFSHECKGEKFYSFKLQVLRKSDTEDLLPCIISEAFISQIEINSGIEIVGEVRTRNVERINGKSKLGINVFVNEMYEYATNKDINEIELHGNLCTKPIYRETPKGRQISDFIVASNRERNNKSDYIPCIAWGRNAVRVSQMEVGTQLEIVGRLQSREYVKNNDPKLAYEVSVSALRVKGD